jgi:AraC family cel operon transcriptional repressor
MSPKFGFNANYPYDLPYWNPSTEVCFASVSTDYPLEHNHEYWEFTLVDKGSYHHFINGKKTLLAADTVTLLRPNDTHCLRTASKNGVHHYNITFRDGLMRRQCAMIGPAFYDELVSGGEIVFAATPELIRKIQNLLHRYRLLPLDQFDRQEFYKKSLFTMLMDAFLTHLIEKADRRNCPVWFSNILKTITDSKNIDFGVDRLCEITGYSRAHLDRLFKQYLNQSPKQFLTRLKLNYACDLLRSTDKNILAIAFDVGYKSLGHFNAAFTAA